MKLSKLSKTIGASALALSISTLPLAMPADAQVNQAPVREPVRTDVNRTGVEDRRDGFDWGWIGLFGLIGLAGLLGGRNRREEPARYREPNEVGNPRY